MVLSRITVTIILLLSLVSIEVSAQRWQFMRHELYASLGASNFLGELGGADQIGTNGLRDLEVSMTRPAFSIGHRYYLTNYLGLKSSLFYGRVNGNDALTNEEFRRNRNLHFRSPIVELSTQVEYFFIKDRFMKNQIRGIASGDSWFDYFSSYVFVGVGGFFFNPKAQYEGEWVALQPLGTEGQGLEGGGEKYSRFSVCIPMGIGFKYQLDRHWSIGLEFSGRKTFTDYIDDVGGTYYDNDKLRQERGDMAADLADPSLGLFGDWSERVTAHGEQRGNAAQNDSYMFALFSIQYRILKDRYNTPRF